MTEYLPHILAALAALIALGWYCYRWVRADDCAAGSLERPNVTPQAGGGPGVPE